MEIIQAYPPIYADIKRHFDITENTIFAWGNKIYNPSGQEISPDLLVHEQIHQKQQLIFGTPEMWWTKYILDKNFRKEQELEAYNAQWLYIKEHIPRASEEAIDDFAETLSSNLYKLNITKHQAKTAIRKYEHR